MSGPDDRRDDRHDDRRDDRLEALVAAGVAQPGGDRVVLDKGGAERLAWNHPWVYRSDVLRMPLEPGFYPVESRRGRTLGWAAVNARSLIAVRMMHRGAAPVTEATLLERLHAALTRREGLPAPAVGPTAAPDACGRLLFAEADGLPALVVDRYGEALVLKSNCAALEPHLDALVAALAARLPVRGVLARLDDAAREREGLPREVRLLHGTVPERVVCALAGVRMRVDPFEGQKTGTFLDQRDNHLRLARHARGRALDAFAYQGGFGLQLAAAADEVELVDSSAAALQRAGENAELNGFANVTLRRADAFERLREGVADGERFDVISLDPPAFAKRRRDVDNAYRAYKELNLQALKLLAPGGVLGTSSCSFHLSPETFDLVLADAAADAGRSLQVLGRWGAAADHPELLGFPESRYLKFTMLRALD